MNQITAMGRVTSAYDSFILGRCPEAELRAALVILRRFDPKLDVEQTMREARANARLIATSLAMYAALTEAEACLSIVEPRSDKAEYLRILDVVRAALAQARGES